MNLSPILRATCAMTLLVGTSVPAMELPPELPLWGADSPEFEVQRDIQEQVRSVPAPPGSPSGLNRAFSNVSSPTYSIHRPKNPNGVGLVICPGGGFRDVWLDREGHDLAIWLKEHNVTSLVLKYRTRAAYNINAPGGWQNYLSAVRSDGRQAIRVLRTQAGELGLQPNKIGISGFSAGGHLAISCALYTEPKLPAGEVSGVPNFAGLFYPGVPDDVGQLMTDRAASESGNSTICPIFIVNARNDQLTPVDKCLDFYASLLRAGVNAELHVFSTGAHGFGMGNSRGKSTSLWPASFVAWLHDANIIED